MNRFDRPTHSNVTLFPRNPPLRRLLSERPESLEFIECLQVLLDPEGQDRDRMERICRRLVGMDLSPSPPHAENELQPPDFVIGEIPSSSPFGLLEAIWNQRIHSGDLAFQGLKEQTGLTDGEWARVQAVAELSRRYGGWWIRSLIPKAIISSEWKPETVKTWLETSQNTSLWNEERIQRVFGLIPASCRRSPREWIGVIVVHAHGPGDFHLLEFGGKNRVFLEARELFGQILSLRPEAFFLFHNHPTGRLEASPSDERLTREVHRLGARLGVPLLGHGVVSPLGERWIAVIRPSREGGPQAMSPPS